MNTQCSPFPELNFTPPVRGFVVRSGNEIKTSKWQKRRGLVMFTEERQALEFAAELEKEGAEDLTIRSRTWAHLVKVIASTRISCIHVVSPTEGVRTVFVK